MELLLNLAWLLLAVPAWWLWRPESRRGGSLQCLLALGCGLVLLFPVISATDDLHAMRAEMDDSTVSKRAVQKAGSDKAFVGFKRAQGPAAMTASAGLLMGWEVRPCESCVTDVECLSRACVLHAGRAPPFFLM